MVQPTKAARSGSVPLGGAAAVRSAAAAVLVAGAFGLLELLQRSFDRLPPFLTFYPAVMVAALLLGFLPGLVATVLSALAAAFWLMEPQGGLAAASRSELAALATFTAAGSFLSVVALVHQRARQRAGALQRELAVRGSADRLHLALRAARAGAWEWEVGTDRSRWSEELHELFGLALGSSQPSFAAWMSAVAPEDRPRVAEMVSASARLGAPVEVEWRMRGRDGAEHWILSKGEPERDGTGEVVRYVGIALDVTERKRAELALRESEERWRLFVEHTPAAVALFDREMRYLAASRRYAEDYRLGDTALLGRSHYEVFPEIPERWRAIHARCLAGATEACEEDPFPRADGTLDWVRWAIHPWRTPDGAIGGVILFSEVVTGRKQAALQVAAERERLEVTLRSIGDAVIATDAAGHVTLVNPVAEELTGFAAGEVAGMPLGEVLHLVNEDTRLPMPDPAGQVLEAGRALSPGEPTLLLARGGTERPVAGIAAPIRDALGRVSGAVLVLRDRSRARQMEEALRAEIEAREQLASVAQNVPGCIYTFRLRPDGSSCLPFGTAAVGEVFGFEPETLTGDASPILARVHLEEQQAILDGIQASARTGSRWQAHFRYQHPAKGLRWLEASAMPSHEPDGSALWHGFAMDVTERKRVEQSVVESEALYRSLFQLAPSGVVLLDEKGGIVAFNDQACRELGYRREEFARLTLADINVEGGDPVSLAARLRGIAEAGGEEFEVGHRTRDGQFRRVLVNSRPVVVGGRNHFLAVWQDVTERRLAEEALRRSELRHRALFEQAAVGVAEVETATGRILEANDRLCELLGYAIGELRGKTWREISSPEELQADQESFDRLAATGQPYQREKRYLRKDGQVLWASLRVSRLAVPGEASSSQIAVVVDITERKRAEAALQESEQRFRALIEKSTEMLLVLGQGGRFQFWSQGAVETLGWTPEEQLGRSALDLVHPDDRQSLERTLSLVAAAPGALSRGVVRWRHRDGSWRQIEATVRNLLQDPAVRGVVLNARDLTSQRLLEEQFQQAQKLETVGRLAGGVAHDFNNLLTVILGCSEALKDELDPGAVQAVEDAEQIRAAGERARDLTRQLLAFARKQVVAPVALDLNALVRGAEKMLGRLLGEDVELKVKLQPGLWTVNADPSQVEQVLLNLAVNARDAMPRGGTLILETRNATVGDPEAGEREGGRAGDWVQLEVRDTGVGITPEVRAHLFEPFFTTKEQGKGTGLGLATVYGIVAQAGGHVQVKSEPGQGARFQICLPRALRVAAAAAAPEQARRSRGTEQLLVVEDDELVRGVIVRALEAEGYQVTAVGQPSRALELAPEELGRLRLLITDVVMPSLDGRQLAEALTARCPSLRVLYLSGYTQDAISERGVLDSGVEFLAKPFTRAALLGKVRALLDAS